MSLANQSIESLKATSSAMGSVFFVEIMGAGSGHLALACAYQARAEGLLVNEHPDPDAYIDDFILGTLTRTLGVPNKSHLFVVAEQTPHRHHPDGGVRGLVEYVASTLSTWPQFQARPGEYRLAPATKATILGHTLRGRPRLPRTRPSDKIWPMKRFAVLSRSRSGWSGACWPIAGRATIEAIPLHAVAPKQFDWEIFARMHGSELP